MNQNRLPRAGFVLTLGTLFPFVFPLATGAPSGGGTAAAEVLMSERFNDQRREDPGASGAAWGAGRLTPGHGGGSGRLGALHIRANETVILDTDLQSFPLAGQPYSIMGNQEPGIDYDPLIRSTWPGVTITRARDGFEFSELQIDDGGTLVLVGRKPGRVFVRGVLVNEGIIDLTGGTPAPHRSNSGSGNPNNNNQDAQDTARGGRGASAGPAGGVGGRGADRIDGSTYGAAFEFVGGMSNPGAIEDGRPGGGVGGQPNSTGGGGGVHYPPMLPQAIQSSSPGFGDAELSDVGPGERCRVAMVAGAGGGGAHALNGGTGLGMSPYTPTLPGLLSNDPPPTPGGDNGSLQLEAPGSPASPSNKRNLDFWYGNLRGGAGGGGGGTSIYASKSNSGSGSTCVSPGWILFPFFDHSAAAGGGGGGAVKIAAGRKLTVTGSIDCRGGDGGSAVTPGAPITGCTQSGTTGSENPDCGDHAAPGGGGAGGAIRLQSQVIEVASASARLDVSGGEGGLGAGLSVGGAGSPGLVRLEYTGFQNQAADAAQFGPSVAPYLPGDPMFNTPFTSAAILSIGAWEDQTLRPDSYSGSQSCWMRPETGTSFTQLDFVADVSGAPTDLSQFGWNMDILFDVPGVGERRFPYRGIPPNDPNDGYDEANFPGTLLGGVDFATYFGMTLNHDEPSVATGSLVAVRFQGVKSLQTIGDLCGVDLTGAAVDPNSLTPFVSHPALLNGFSPQPDMLRFAVVFDEQLAAHDPAVAGRVRGITNLRIRVIPN